MGCEDEWIVCTILCEKEQSFIMLLKVNMCIGGMRWIQIYIYVCTLLARKKCCNVFWWLAGASGAARLALSVFLREQFHAGWFCILENAPPPRLPCAQGLLMHKFESRVQTGNTPIPLSVFPSSLFATLVDNSF